VEAAKASGLE
jgi:hypothetical protein